MLCFEEYTLNSENPKSWRKKKQKKTVIIHFELECPLPSPTLLPIHTCSWLSENGQGMQANKQWIRD